MGGRKQMADKAKRCVIGMDAGTTNCKAVVLTEDGQIVAKASRESFMSLSRGDQREQEADTWWDCAVHVFADLMSVLDEKGGYELSGVSISSHTVSLLPLDIQGRPVRPAILYQDGRSVKEVKYLTDRIGFERFVKIVGGQPSAAFLPGKLLWFKEKEPELFAKTEHIVQCSSYLVYRLTGQLSSDLDQATRTQCLDMRTMQWSKEIGDALGVDLDRLLPPVSPVDAVIGTLTAQAAAQTGLPEGTPVLAGCSDALAAMHAIGMSRLGEAGESSGTSSLVFAGSAVQSEPTVPVVTRPCTIEGMPWIFDAPITTTGAVLRWFIDTFADREKKEAKEAGVDIYTYLNEMADKAPCGCRGLLFYPYLLGERAPLWNDHAKGMFIGLRADTTRAELVRSLFEGTAFALRHVLETVGKSGARVESLRICGGGAKSDTWNQIKASMLGLTVHAMDDLSGDVPVGSALLAGVRFGLFSDFKQAADGLIHVRKTFEPDPKQSKVYDRMFPLYVQMYAHLDKDLQRMKFILENEQ